MSVLAYLLAVWVFLIGVYGLVTSRNLIHAVVCLSVCQSSTYVLLLAIGYQWGATAPVFSGIASDAAVVDPVVQAMVLTDVVVNAAVTALLLAIAIQVHKRHHTIDPDRLRSLHG
ncbi:MAG TPA: cation:proton antiporter subunit C [Salinisphaeraceae bacterium]|nr:cation:proton antiporter subunit C [Salinisphaeraceae bacterium]